MSDPQATQRIRPRAYVLGVVAVALLALVTPWNDWPLGNTQLFSNYLPPPVTLLLLAAALANHRLGRWRLRPRELVVVAIMLLGLGGVIEGGMLRLLMPAQVGTTRVVAAKEQQLETLRRPATADELAADRARARELAAAELVRWSSDGTPRVALADLPIDPGPEADRDRDGALDADEWLAWRLAREPGLVAAERWHLPAPLLVGLDRHGGVDRGDPEHRHVVDGMVDGLDRPGQAEAPRIDHGASVTWRGADGVSHRATALAGRARDRALLAGEPLLDLEDPAFGEHLRRARAGDTVATPAGAVSVLAVEAPGVPWSAWGSLLAWSPLLLAAICGMLGLAGIVRHQWIHHERLTYPIATIYGDLIDRSAGGSPLWRDTAFRWALLIAVVLLAWRGLHHHGLVPLGPRMEWRFTDLAWHTEPFRSMPDPFWFCSPKIFLGIAAMAFLMPANISFSLWFTYIAGNLVLGLTNLGGVTEVRGGELSEATTGGFLAYALFIVWLGRRHYLQVLRAAVGLDASSEARAARPHLWLLVGGSLGIAAFAVAAGASVGLAVLLVVFLWAMLIVVARLVAETGLPSVQLHLGVNNLVLPIFGVGASAAALLPLALVGMVLATTTRESLLGHAVNAHRLADRQQLPRRRTTPLLLGAAAIGLVLGAIGFVTAGYLGGGALRDDWSYRAIADHHTVAQVVRVAADAEGEVPAVAAEARGATLGRWTLGGLVVGALGWARIAFSWWPLHPIGFVLMQSWALKSGWFSILLGWCAKSLVMRYGGTGLYARLRTAAIGLICGEAVVIALFLLAGVVAWLLGHDPGRFEILPG